MMDPKESSSRMKEQISVTRSVVFSILIIGFVFGVLELASWGLRKSLGLGPVAHGLYVHHPTRLWAMRPNHEGEMPGGIRIRTNELGFRSPQISPARKDRTRIVILGDSVSFGWAVREEDSWPRLLEEELNRASRSGTQFEVVNTGVVGYGTLQEAAVLAELGQQLNPDVVVLQFFPNDILENFVYSTKGDLSATLERSSLYKLIRDSYRRVRGSRTYAETDRNFDQAPRKATRQVAKNEFGVNKSEVVFSTNNEGILSDAWLKTSAAVVSIEAKARKLDARLLAVIFPASGQAEGRINSTVFQDSLKAICSRKGIAVLDFYDEYVANPEGYHGSHPSVTGHALASNMIARFLEEQLPAIENRPLGVDTVGSGAGS